MITTECNDGDFDHLMAGRSRRRRRGRYYHASGEQRAVIWRAVSNEKPIIVKNISYFRNYFKNIRIFLGIFESRVKIVNFWTYDRGLKN